MTITAKELRERSLCCNDLWKDTLLQAADTIEELEMELVCRPAKVEVTRGDLKECFLDWATMHNKLVHRSSDRDQWETLFRLCKGDLDQAYSDGAYTLDEVKSWRSMSPEERPRAKRKALFTESLRGWGLACGIDQAREWWMVLNKRGGVPEDLDAMRKAVNWIGVTIRDRGLGVSFAYANKAAGLIDEYRQGRQ